MPSKTARRKRHKAAVAAARSAAHQALDLKGGRTSIAEVARVSGSGYGEAQYQLRQEQVERARNGESISGASAYNGFTKARDDDPIAIAAWMLQALRTLSTYAQREAVIAIGHKNRNDLPQWLVNLIDEVIFVDMSLKHVNAAITIADAAMQAEIKAANTP